MERKIQVVTPSVKDYVADAVGDVIRCGGKFVSKETFIERLKVCAECKFSGVVRPLPLVKVEGCKKCGCPFIMKPATYENCGDGSKKITKCPNGYWSKIKPEISDFGIPIDEKINLINEIFKRQ